MAIFTFQTLKSFAQFLWNFKLSGSPLVDQNTANIRAQTCVSCHNNIASGDVKKGGCGVCQKMGNAALNGIRADIIGNNNTPVDPYLLTCGICGCDLKMSVWIPNVVLVNVEDVNAYPAFCWKKLRLENRDL